MFHDAVETDAAHNAVMKIVTEVNKVTQLPRSAVMDLCPVCNVPIKVIHGEAVCTSAVCRRRIIEGCCGN